MAIIRFVTPIKNGALAVIRTAMDAGPGPATIKFYTGVMPTLPSDAVTTQTLLGTATFSDPCGSETGGVLTAAAITQDSAADATGTATWARIADSTGATCYDVDVGVTGGGAACQMNTTAIVAGGPILVSSLTITVP